MTTFVTPKVVILPFCYQTVTIESDIWVHSGTSSVNIMDYFRGTIYTVAPPRTHKRVGQVMTYI